MAHWILPSAQENGMQPQIKRIKEILGLIRDLQNIYNLERNNDSCGPLLYTVVAGADLIGNISGLVEKHFGTPYKPAGRSALFKNLFTEFASSVGGMQKNQTYYRQNISDELTLYVAFRPWGSAPEKVSIRIELLYNGKGDSHYLEKELAEYFS